MSENRFDWIPIYHELAISLIQYSDLRNELIEKIRKVYDITGIKMPTLEKDNKIGRICSPGG